MLTAEGLRALESPAMLAPAVEMVVCSVVNVAVTRHHHATSFAQRPFPGRLRTCSSRLWEHPHVMCDADWNGLPVSPDQTVTITWRIRGIRDGDGIHREHGMCGIAGFLGGKRFAPEEAPSIACGMADAVAHRGPDDAGVWLDGGAEIALATGAWPSSIRRRPVANRCSPPPGEASSHSSLGAAWSIQGLVGSATRRPAAAGGGLFRPSAHPPKMACISEHA